MSFSRPSVEGKQPLNLSCRNKELLPLEKHDLQSLSRLSYSSKIRPVLYDAPLPPYLGAK